jgi:hypothetical protein
LIVNFLKSVLGIWFCIDFLILNNKQKYCVI